MQTPDRKHREHREPHQTTLRPGDPDKRDTKRDTSTPGELWAFVLAAARIGGFRVGYGGLAGLGRVMVARMPVIHRVPVTISVCSDPDLDDITTPAPWASVGAGVCPSGFRHATSPLHSAAKPASNEA